MREKVQAVVDKWVESFNDGRVDELGGYYTSDARIIPPGRPTLKGLGEITEFFSDIRAQGFRDYAVDIIDVFDKDGVTIASGRWGLTGPASAGARQRYEGNWLNVVDDPPSGLKIALHMWN